MCMSCGCGAVNEDHGNPDHITMEKMQKAASAAGISVSDAAENIQSSM